jgi:hypothetical protein
MYAQMLTYLIIHVFTYALFILRNPLRMIKIYRNMSELWEIVCKNIICILVYLFVLLYEKTSQNTETPSFLIPYSQ